MSDARSSSLDERTRSVTRNAANRAAVRPLPSVNASNVAALSPVHSFSFPECV